MEVECAGSRVIRGARRGGAHDSGGGLCVEWEVGGGWLGCGAWSVRLR